MIAGSATIVPPLTVVDDASIVPCTRRHPHRPTATRTATRTVAAGLDEHRDGDRHRRRRRDPTPDALTPSPTPTATPPPACVGDCNGNGTVTVNELIVGVNIALGNQPASTCPAFDVNGSGTVIDQRADPGREQRAERLPGVRGSPQSEAGNASARPLTWLT